MYAGVIGNEYDELIYRSGRPADAYQLLGNSASILAARIAYVLNWKGPSLSIDTACSSSLVAVDLACQALQRGEIDLALAGGVTLYLTERPFIFMSRAGMLAADGKCKTFDRRADGVVPGEGVGVVVLKPLVQALRDRDYIYGVIKASGTNQDGRTNGITAPSAASQTELIQHVHRRAGIDPSSISFVEAHGTGTSLGDPIEVTALAQAFQQSAKQQNSCALGAVKTNIGHTSAAAGVAGLVKMLLSLTHRQIPATLHFEQANDRIRFEETPFYVNTQRLEWPANESSPRRGAVSSFGFSGVNAHVVVEEAPPRSPEPSDAGLWPVAVSAKTPAALKQRLQDLAEHLEREAQTPALRDLSFTLNTGRQPMKCRAAYVARDSADLQRQLREAVNNLANAEQSPSATDALALYPQLVQVLLTDLAAAPRRDEPAFRDKLTALVELHRQGHDVDWDVLYRGIDAWRIPLPAYPFARERYWCDPLPQTALEDSSTPPHLVPRSTSTANEFPWLFQPAWVDQPLAVQDALAMSPSGPILVLDADPELAAVVRRQCPGEIVIHVAPGSDYAWAGPETQSSFRLWPCRRL